MFWLKTIIKYLQNVTGPNPGYRYCNGVNCNKAGIAVENLRYGLGELNYEHRQCNTQDCPPVARGVFEFPSETQVVLAAPVNASKNFWQHAWHKNCIEYHSSKMVIEGGGSIVCERHICKLICPEDSPYVDGRSKVMCNRDYKPTKSFSWNGKLG